jgi:PPK2 family polyphosphate:nucleotide phosphotransferase
VRSSAPLDVDPRSTPCFDGDKRAGKAALATLLPQLSDQQRRLYATGSHGLLVVLQGRDASGKDGTLRHVLEGMTPLGFRAHAFKAPTEIEAAHDFLWRAHQVAPGLGEFAVFNRSHYEDVLARRVRGLDPEERWRPRYAHIREFERLLAGDGRTVIVKLYLHISRDEQAERLRSRLDDPTKHWKFRLGDLDDRRLWAEYDRAYTETLTETDADAAPWYVIPADRKWYRNLAVAHVLLETLQALGLDYPEPEEDLSSVRIE